MSYFAKISQIADLLHAIPIKAYAYALRGAALEVIEEFPHISELQAVNDIASAVELKMGNPLAGDTFEELDLNAFGI